jgi:cubilin
MTDSPVTLVPETTAPATAVPTSLLPTVLTDTPVTFVPETTAPVTAVPTRRTPVATCASSGTIYTTLSGPVLDGEGYYSNNAVCSWLISTGTRITLTFSQFSTEAGYDHVHVYDGSSSGYLLRVLDGNAIPGPIVATSGSMFIEFSSDFSVTSEGFSATWAADAPTTVPTPAPTRVGDTIPPTTLNPTSVPTFEVATCATSGTTYTRLTGTITDGYAHRYHDDSECSWTISTGSAITLQFTEFHTEQAYDFVTVYDGASIQEGGFLGQFSGSTIPRTVTATSGSMVIFFTSDYSVTQTGFTAMWF